MNAFELETLLLPTFAIFLLTLVVSYRVTKMPAASILVALIKSGIFLVYFGFLFDGTFIFSDSLLYLAGGKRIFYEGITIFNLMDNWQFVIDIIGTGNHIIYYLYNAFSFYLFGIAYFAPVACNILLTVLIAYFGYRLAVKEFGLSYREGKWFYLFLLLQPDILAWSNTMNGKDILVLLLHILLLQAVALFYKQRMSYALLIAIPVVTLFLFLRFYVPMLFALALVVTLILHSKGKLHKQFTILFVGVVLAYVVYLLIGERQILFATYAIQANFENPFYGFIRMLLTPIPFNTDAHYAFLNIPALLHWMMIPLVIIAVVNLYKRKDIFANFFLVYVCIFIALYAFYTELQGPRHRLQLDYIFAFLQFTGFLIMAKYFTITKKYKVTAKSVIGANF